MGLVDLAECVVERPPSRTAGRSGDAEAQSTDVLQRPRQPFSHLAEHVPSATTTSVNTNSPWTAPSRVRSSLRSVTPAHRGG